MAKKSASAAVVRHIMKEKESWQDIDKYIEKVKSLEGELRKREQWSNNAYNEQHERKLQAKVVQCKCCKEIGKIKFK